MISTIKTEIERGGKLIKNCGITEQGLMLQHYPITSKLSKGKCIDRMCKKFFTQGIWKHKRFDTFLFKSGKSCLERTALAFFENGRREIIQKN